MKQVDSKPSILAQLLKNADVFSGISESAIQQLAGYASLHLAPTGTTIIKEGAVAPMLCLIVDGSVNIIKELGEPEPRTVATLSAGKSLGEMSLMDGLPFSATAKAEEDTRLVVFTREELDRLALDHPEIYNRVICGLSRQITERLRHTTDVLASHLSQTAELTDALNEALRAAQARSSFVADMGHRMRTPLNAIVGFAELLDDDVASGDLDACQADITSIREACETMARLMTDMLDLSKIESGRVKLQLEEIGVDYLLQELATSCEAMVSKNGNRLIVKCDESVGIIKADEIQLRQILLNLLENASKYTESGEITVSASCGKGDNGEWIEFKVSDTGRGMSQQQIEDIFGRYSKADSNVRAKYAGTGLGLAISQSLCKMFGGKIEVKSQRGVGTTFTVLLPRIPIIEQAPAPA